MLYHLFRALHCPVGWSWLDNSTLWNRGTLQASFTGPLFIKSFIKATQLRSGSFRVTVDGCQKPLTFAYEKNSNLSVGKGCSKKQKGFCWGTNTVQNLNLDATRFCTRGLRVILNNTGIQTHLLCVDVTHKKRTSKKACLVLRKPGVLTVQFPWKQLVTTPLSVDDT